MRKTYIGTSLTSLLIALLILGLAPSARARGEGIKAGSGRLHFGADLELIFDTNPGYFPSDNANKAMDLVLRARPLFSLDFPSDSVSFEFNGKVGYDYYFGVQNSQTTNLSTVTGDADLRLGFNPEGQFSFFFIDTFSRTGNPRYTALSGRFDRTDNEAKALFKIRPGGGALSFDLAYAFFLDWFDNSFAGAKALSSYAHRVFFSGKWKFLPKTALSVDFDADLRRYPNSYTDGSKNVDVNGIRATLGLIGQISPSISVVVKAGYGDTLLGDALMAGGQPYTGGDYRSVVGQAEMTYQATTTFFQVGYLRSFQPVMLFAYFGQDHFYARFRQQLAGRFSLEADLAFDLLDYGAGIHTAEGEGSRFDYFLFGGATFEYHPLDWLSLGLQYQFQALFSGFHQVENDATVDYNRHAVIFRVGLDY